MFKKINKKNKDTTAVKQKKSSVVSQREKNNLPVLRRLPPAEDRSKMFFALIKQDKVIPKPVKKKVQIKKNIINKKIAKDKIIKKQAKMTCNRKNPSPPCKDNYSEKLTKKGNVCCYKKKLAPKMRQKCAKPPCRKPRFK